MNNINRIISFFDELYPDAYCELNYKYDYELLIAIVLSAQTTDKRVNVVTKKLFDKYKTIYELADASLEDLENIIRELGTYKKKSVFVKEIASRIVNDCNGKVVADRKYLESLPGVGRKTVNVFFAEYYKIPAFAVDTHVNRVSKRLNLVTESASVLDVENKLKTLIPKDRWIKSHHQFIFFGRYFCKAISPNCSKCKLCDICSYYKSKRDN